MCDELKKEWDRILQEDGLDIIGGNCGDNGIGIVKTIDEYKYNINEILGDIEMIKDSPGEINFYFEGKKIGFCNIEYKAKNVIFIKLIANVNATKEDYYSYELYEYGLVENYKIKGLLYYMYKKLIEFFKKKGINEIYGEIFNYKISDVTKKLLEEGVIKNIKIDGNYLERTI